MILEILDRTACHYNILQISYLVPGRSPENVRGYADRSISFYIHWDEVVSNFVHGILLGYEVKIQKTNDVSDVRYVFVNATRQGKSTYYVRNAQKYTEYTIWVKAVNSKGAGKLNSPEGWKIRTKEDGMFYVTELSRFIEEVG